MAQTVSSKRKPPTFQHLPEQKGKHYLFLFRQTLRTEVFAVAKKLKKLWVEKQKIKSKWKAQKRKEGIITRQDDITTTGTGQPETVNADNESEDDEVENSNTNATPEVESEPESTPAPPPKRKKLSKAAAEEEEAEKPSLRELQRQAYSPASLHHYKSDPLHRHRGRGSSFGNRGGRGGGSDRGRGSRGGRGSNGRGQIRGRGGGQPDMRLRMSAMLEKIKQDMS